MKKLAALLLVGSVATGLAVTNRSAVPPTDGAPSPASKTSHPAVSPAPEASPSAAASAQIELKNKSSFAVDQATRNPFWPIGWKPSPKVTKGETDSAGPEIPPSAFLVSSITVDKGGSFAIINGRAMTEGQAFGLQLGNQTYQLTVKTIQDGQVILQRRDQEIAVPLRRR
ncbi:MAG: hypothetical protein ACR2F0_09270 [Chthoniobacterales bacterium]